ncbi:hypothetical protein SLEP1_g47785 [Rubroshorea leprosula]|uniref:DUF4220 domain-containing protein n=1 Tax=Rubroshorea leprosula TaxID=152421 RepID=A0AAV5LUE2_9ROSI|nr:hypothetical protein SLEP1_g47785 [Rubroshorea leprosula]
MSLSVLENAKKLWATWNIRGFVIVSLSVQVFLILFAPFRKWRGRWGKCVHWLIWSAYLLADWVAEFSIGLIVSKQIESPDESSDIYVFWAPFLLLHLGCPEAITSFALEDNEFWVRHLLALALQVGSTVYVFVRSLPENKLWLPTILVSVAEIIKYAERNRAFYLARFDHFGDDWVPSECEDELPVPVEFQKMDKDTFGDQSKSILWTAVHHFGTIKMMLVGLLLPRDHSTEIREAFLQETDPSKVLQIFEIELSLLYEVLHTKLPVVGCRIGYIFRSINLCCILGALLSFLLFKKYYKLEQFDVWLTYGLLIGALVLDFMSIILLIFSDWILVAHMQSTKPRWLKECRMLEESSNVQEARDVWLYSRKLVLDSFVVNYDLTDIKELYYTKSVLTWHIATELCFLGVDQTSSSGIEEEGGQGPLSGIESENHKELCKLLSDYMFNLLVMQPTMMAGVSATWKIVFEKTLTEARLLLDSSLISNEKEARKKIQELIPCPGKQESDLNNSVLITAAKLARELKKSNSIPWESMSKVWVQLMCIAAMSCKPTVHAQQPSKGGELLTFVWLLMSHLGFGTYFSSRY